MSPWKAAWRLLPPYLRRALEGEDVTNDDDDAPSYARMWDRFQMGHSDVLNDALEKAHLLHMEETTKPEDATRSNPTLAKREALERYMSRLAQAANATRRYSASTISMHHWMAHSASPFDPRQSAAASLPQEGPKATYRPRKPANGDPTTQQDKDKAETRKWADRLLAALKPHPLPYLQQNPHHEDQIALLGSTRSATLCTHALTVEKTLVHYPNALRWREGANHMTHIAHMLRSMRELGYKPSRLQKAWKTLNWLGLPWATGPPTNTRGS